MANKVKCPVCEKRFYKEEVDFVKKGRRYYHKECVEEQAEVDEANSVINHENMIEIIKEIFDIKYPSPRILKQIKDYGKKGYTYFGIWKTLEYWFILEGNSTKKAHGGIGIVPYVYEDASIYYKKIKESKESGNQKLNKEQHKVVIGRPDKKSVFEKRKIDMKEL